jgi:UDP-N-acetylmuramate--alanine ligase
MDNKRAFFMGIGGIGMSALARWLHQSGVLVAGYDRTPSEITDALQAEGLEVVFTEEVSALPPWIEQNPQETLVVRTPAVPTDHPILLWLEQKGCTIVKRSELLGKVSEHYKLLAVAGTHGKTTTSAMVTWLLHEAGLPVGAFLGGIAGNFDSNLIPPPHQGALLVAEADEFDRSFLQLHPWLAIVTTTDPDHLDVYHTKESFVEGFKSFVRQIQPGGFLILRKGTELPVEDSVKVYTYAVGADSEATARNIGVTEEGRMRFDYVGVLGTFSELELALPGLHNLENAIAAITAALLCGATEESIRKGLKSFRGVQRRFDIKFQSSKLVFLDDYAHHPTEIEALIESIHFVFPGRKLTLLFQPHLYSRTRDFSNGFAHALSKADVVWLLDIYPARELPIPGIDAQYLLDKIVCTSKRIIKKDEVLQAVETLQEGVFATVGAGDIDRLVNPITKILNRHGKVD